MVRSRNKALGILVLVALAFAAYVYFYEMKYKTHAAKVTEEKQKAFSALKETLTQVRVKTTYGEMTWVRDGAQWNFQSPIVAEADAAEVTRSLDELYNTAFVETVPGLKADQLKNFGFYPDDDKNYYIEFESKTGADAPSDYLTLLIGDDTPVNNSFYTMLIRGKYTTPSSDMTPEVDVPDGYVPDVYVVDKSLKSAFYKEITAFRAKNLLSFVSADIQSAQLKDQNSRPKFSLRRNESPSAESLIKNISWWVNQDIPADVESVDSLFSDLKDLKAQDFIDETPTDKTLQAYGLHKPDLTFTLTDKSNTTVKLIYRKSASPKDKDRGIASVAGKNLLFRVKDADMQKVNLQAKKLYQTKPFERLQLTSLMGVTFKYRGEDAHELSYDKLSGKWLLIATDKPATTQPVEIKEDKVKAFEETLNAIELTQITPTNTQPSAQTGWPMEMVFKFAGSSKSLWYRTQGKNAVFLVPEYGLKLEADKSTLQNAFEPFFTYAHFYDPVNEEKQEMATTPDQPQTQGELKMLTTPLSPKIEMPAKTWAEKLHSPIQAVVEVEGKGKVKISLEVDKAPLTVANFVNLATHQFYNGLTFHRVIEDFMAQGGDPSGNGTGGPGYKFEDETTNGLKHDRGVISMANSGPNTNGSQFFITFQPQPHLDGKHTVFGHVVEGMDIVDQLKQGDKITAIQINAM